MLENYSRFSSTNSVETNKSIKTKKYFPASNGILKIYICQNCDSLFHKKSE